MREKTGTVQTVRPAMTDMLCLLRFDGVEEFSKRSVSTVGARYTIRHHLSFSFLFTDGYDGQTNYLIKYCTTVNLSCLACILKSKYYGL